MMEVDPQRQETLQAATTSEGPLPAVTPEVTAAKTTTRDETTPEEGHDGDGRGGSTQRDPQQLPGQPSPL